MTTGTDQLRRLNTALVLRTLRGGGPGTRAELAARTGLAKATVGAIATDLLGLGALLESVEAPAGDGTRGRPGRPLSLAGRAFVGLGLELNVDYVAAVAVDLAGEVLLSESRPAGAVHGTDPVASLVDLAAEVTAGPAGLTGLTGLPGLTGSTVVGVTVAVPALVRDDDRSIAWSPNLDLDGPGLAERLEEALPGLVPGTVRVVNDANCAAYAEAHHGAAAGVAHALYLTGTVGIGAGILSHGRLVQGGAGFAGEVGHIPVGDPGARCGCGRRGCWEASIGLHALLEEVGAEELDSPVETAAAVAARAADEPAVATALARVGHDIGLGLATLASVLDPEVVVLGGYFVPLGELVLAPAREVLDQRLASTAQVRPELRLSTLGLRAAALGAAEQSFAPILTGAADLPLPSPAPPS